MKHVLVILMLAACGTPTPVGADPDGPGSSTDSPGNAITIPTWRLEDVQPQSPSVGQTYGLDTFNGKVVVVTLLEGF